MDGEPAVFEQKDVRARKEYKCCECGCKINKGELYSLNKGLWDGNWGTYRQCSSCSYYFKYITKVCFDLRNKKYDLVCFEQLREWMSEYQYNVPLAWSKDVPLHDD